MFDRRVFALAWALDELGRRLSVQYTGAKLGELRHDGSGFRSDEYLRAAVEFRIKNTGEKS